MFKNKYINYFIIRSMVNHRNRAGKKGCFASFFRSISNTTILLKKKLCDITAIKITKNYLKVKIEKLYNIAINYFLSSRVTKFYVALAEKGQEYGIDMWMGITT